MTYVTHTQCTVCGSQYSLDEVLYTCPTCGPVGTLDIQYDFTRLRADWTPEQLATAVEGSRWQDTMWRYRPLLPIIDDDFMPSLPVGWTPLIEAPRLADLLGIKSLWIKDDGRNPTASHKDRASAMVVARALQIGAPVVTAASTGNAAAALAGVCANVGKKAVIFVPGTAPEAKIAQMLVFGATVFAVQGTYDDAFELCLKTAEEYGWYCRNTGINPFTTEGKKTAALEIAEQLGWQAPDVMVVSVGDGSIIGAQYKGFHDLLSLGWIHKLPRLIGVQAEGSSSLVKAWISGQDPTEMIPGPAETIADSISAGLPRDRVKALRAVRETGGEYVSVPDSAILAAIPELAQYTGVFAEPAAAATLAGLRQAQLEGAISPHERVVLLITGSGLKDVRAAMQSVGTAHKIENSMTDVRHMIKQLALVGNPTH
ncbi:MAG: threonine synthase [Chloroflexota bacterium]